jgi:adenosylcobinamide-GDP ribazoletransferase
VAARRCAGAVVLRSLAIAFGFLTRIPVATGAVEPHELGRAVTWFPVVGGALGAAMVAVGLALAGWLPPGLVAIAVVALTAVTTGGLHLDGVADVFDALGGGRGNRDRMLAIMRDSRIGAHGAAALVLVLAGKLVAIAEIVERGPRWALFAAPIAARWSVIPLIIGFPYARADGLGKPFHGHAGVTQFVAATGIAAIALAWIGPFVAVPVVVALAAALGLAIWLYRRLGGITGDVCGAAIELAELGFLVAVVVAAR